MNVRASWSTRQAPGSRDTIFAISTPPGRSGVAVIRISGPHAGEVLTAVTGRTFVPREATLSRFSDPTTGERLDEGLALWFPAPRSFTGEDSVEFQLHGSRAVIAAMAQVLAAQRGMREARAGEFTQRAFEHGKLNGAQVEALADLIDAQTDRQRRLALRMSSEGPSSLANGWRDRVLDFLAEIDARLDFSDEGDVDALQEADLSARIQAFASDVETVVARANHARRLREGFVVAICGPPNSGKSTLLNALTGRDQSIVSPFAGTTRDAIEVSLDLDGVLVTLIDTAGIRDTTDQIERVGIDRARQAATRADLTIWLEAPDIRAEPEAGLAVDMRVMSKADILREQSTMLQVSALTGEGLDHLLKEIGTRAAGDLDESGDAVTLRERHILLAQGIAGSAGDAADHCQFGVLEVSAAALRATLAPLAALGSNAMEDDVLDRIFGRFCIGK